MTKEWGPPTWMFFHSFAEKINEEFYRKNASYILDMIKQICNCLPCPTCQTHATQYMSKIRVHHVLTKEQFKNMLWTFHNTVNIRLQKRTFTKKELTMYKRANFPLILNHFRYQMTRNWTLNRSFNEQLFRIRIVSHINNFILKNRNQFQ
jgi:hypothetical protein